MEMRTIHIGDLGDIKTGSTPSKKNPDNYGEYALWIKPTDINPEEKYTRVVEEMFSEKAANDCRSRLIPAMSICVPCIGTVGTKLTMTPCDCFVNQSINAVIPNDDYDNDYVYYLLLNFLPNLKSINKGTASGREYIAKSAFENIEIKVHSDIKVQRIIGKILSAYDDMIDNCKKQIALLEEAAQRLYREWFVELRFPGHATTPIGDNGYPTGWRETKLDDITSKFATGLNPRKNFVLGKGENYYVTIKNLTQTYVVLDDKCDKVDDEALLKINRRSDLKAGDLLFSGIGTIGRVALVPDTPTNWNISESLFTLRPNDLVSSEYLYLLLLDSGVQGYAQANSQGSAQKGIRMAALKAYSFMLPSDRILKLFDNLIKPYIESLKVNHKMLNYYTEARSHLLPRLISGQIEINA